MENFMDKKYKFYIASVFNWWPMQLSQFRDDVLHFFCFSQESGFCFLNQLKVCQSRMLLPDVLEVGAVFNLGSDKSVDSSFHFLFRWDRLSS